MPPQADGMVTVSFSTAALWGALGAGVPMLGGGIWALLRWFLTKLDDKETKYQAHLDRVVAQAAAVQEVAWKRAEVSEQRSLAIHERSVGAIESVKGGLDRLVDRFDSVDGESRPGSLRQQPRRP